jgi:hypothetical protein
MILGKDVPKISQQEEINSSRDHHLSRLILSEARKDLILKKKVFWSLAGFLLVCLPVLALVRGNMIPPASAAPSSVAMVKTTSHSDAAARSYWTPERQKNAISADTLTPKQKASSASLTQSRNVSPAPKKGKPVSKPPTAPSKPRAASQKQALDQQQTAPVSSPSSATGTAVSTFPTVLSQSSATSQQQALDSPISTIGKVFFTDPTTPDVSYVCSGTVVTSNNRSTIDTAGHCVAKGGGQYFYTNWTFCPQWNGVCPDGNLWTARLLLADPDWYNNGWLGSDYGEVVVNPNANGNVVDAIGGAGWTYNQPYEQQYAAFGFPENGDPLSECTSFYANRVVFDGDPGPADVAITCDMAHGSSGGGWFISLDGNFGFLNGHNDTNLHPDYPYTTSPYYGDKWFALFNQAQNA